MYLSYIHNTHRKDMYLSRYEHTVEPINSEQYWEITGLPPSLPPLIKVQPVRPKKNDMTKMMCKRHLEFS